MLGGLARSTVARSTTVPQCADFPDFLHGWPAWRPNIGSQQAALVPARMLHRCQETPLAFTAAFLAESARPHMWTGRSRAMSAMRPRCETRSQAPRPCAAEGVQCKCSAARASNLGCRDLLGSDVVQPKFSIFSRDSALACSPASSPAGALHAQQRGSFCRTAALATSTSTSCAPAAALCLKTAPALSRAGVPLFLLRPLSAARCCFDGAIGSRRSVTVIEYFVGADLDTRQREGVQEAVCECGQGQLRAGGSS